MKLISLFTAALMASLAVSAQKDFKLSDPSTCPFELGSKIEVKLPENVFSKPKISSDGSMLLLTKKHKGVYVVNLNNPNNVKRISDGRMDGFSMKWEKDDKITFRRTTRISEGNFKQQYIVSDPLLKSYSAHDITNINFPVTSLSKDSVLIVEYDLMKKELVANNGTKSWIIASGITTCLNAVLSPDKSKIVFRGNGKSHVYDVKKSQLINDLDAGLGKSWSPDGQYILHFKDFDKGTHGIVESDLYICKADGSAYWKLTDTPDILEVDSHWSADGSTITYTDLKTGKIYITPINKK